DVPVQRRLRAIDAQQLRPSIEGAREERADRAEAEDRDPHRLPHFLRLERLLERCALALLHREAVLRIREAPLPDIGVEPLEGIDDDRPELGVALRELRLELAEQAEDVVEHEHLAVTVNARTDADRGDGQALGGELGDRRRDRLEDDRERAGVLERERVVEELAGRATGLRLDLEATELRNALRREPDVG